MNAFDESLSHHLKKQDVVPKITLNTKKSHRA